MPRKRKATTKKKTASTKRAKSKAAAPKAAKITPGGVVVEIEACKSWCVKTLFRAYNIVLQQRPQFNGHK